jgi:hypothetical protein
MRRIAQKTSRLLEGVDPDERARRPTFRRGSEMPWKERPVSSEPKGIRSTESSRIPGREIIRAPTIEEGRPAQTRWPTLRVQHAISQRLPSRGPALEDVVGVGSRRKRRSGIALRSNSSRFSRSHLSLDYGNAPVRTHRTGACVEKPPEPLAQAARSAILRSATLASTKCRISRRLRSTKATLAALALSSSAPTPWWPVMSAAMSASNSPMRM